ncbi:hypothetical protein ACJIZ3_001767 [Penstemon smallii]|uniref:G-patch domain-containing protein n=1 Tax=Penstemon smallii TaxID=265156 RepID=A0ABD3U4H4_9LAMI
MSFSFTIPSKPQPNRTKKPSLSFSAAAGDPPTSSSASKNYVSEFNASEPSPPFESKIKPIAPIPNDWRPNIKLKNLNSIPQSNGTDSSLQFELDQTSNTEPSDSSIGYGLNLRQPTSERVENISEMELRKLREDLEKLPDDTGMEEFEDVPVDGFGAALLYGYGWKEGKGIGRNAKEDIKVNEVIRKTGRGGLGFTGDLPDIRADSNGGNAGESNGKNASVGREKSADRKENKRFGVGKEVRVVNGREMGMKGKISEVRSGGDVLILRTSKSGEKVKVRTRDVAEVGSAEEEKFLNKKRKFKQEKDKRDRSPSSKMSREKKRKGSERVNWLRTHIRVRIISEKLKGGRLFLKKGVVVDVVGPGLCDISMDESNELLQGVDQELLETALPKRGGPVLVLGGRYKGVYGTLLERDAEKEMGIVRDADSHEFLNVRLDQIAEFTGDPSDVGLY